MNLYNGLNQMMDYIEKHIDEDISMTTLAHFLGCSSYTMERIFSMMTGFTIKEYIKKRRFSLAVISLMEGKKVIDVAIECGYTSPTSFSRKFYEIYKIHPSEIKDTKIDLYLQPVLNFEEKQYNDFISYRIEHTKEQIFYGKKEIVKENIPLIAEKFWDEMKLKYPKILNNLPRYALIEEKDNQTFYWILLKEKEPNLEYYIIPEGKWLVFKGSSFKGIDIEKLSNKIYDEYLKSTSFKEKGNYTLELYYEDYMEVWVLID